MKKVYSLVLFFIGLLTLKCKKPYEPEVIKAPNNYLVVDGFVNMSPNSQTTITLSRSRNLQEAETFLPEFGASVIIESRNGSAYNLFRLTDGVYRSPSLTLSQNDQYRIKIQTQNGNQYLSDYVSPKISPQIDSISWEQNTSGNVNLFVSSQDPAGKTRYYRWDFVETWEYHAPLEGSIGLDGSMIYYFQLRPQAQTFKCWKDRLSTSIVVGSSIALNNDVISKQPIQTIPKDDERITQRYSMLLSQYAITEDAHKYWDIVNKNSQQLGTLFDLQPSQLKGNIYSVTSSAEPVLGYLSATTITQRRIFIDNRQLNNWTRLIPHNACEENMIPQNPDPFFYNYSDTTFYPYFFVSGGGLMIAKRYCVDCRTRGGSNQKPAFW
jgi:hypothetical protein